MLKRVGGRREEGRQHEGRVRGREDERKGGRLRGKIEG
jgi:hypothetical protein